VERKSRKIWVRIFTLLCFLILSVSCSSREDGEESTDNAVADTSEPTVTAISPEDGATDVSVSSTISVIFSKSIEPVYATISSNEVCSGTMQISTDSFNSCIPAVLTYDTSRRTYTLTAGSSSVKRELASLTNHQLKVTTGIKDYFGKALAEDYTSTGFTTSSVCSSGCSWTDAGSSGLSAGIGHTLVFHQGKLWVMGGGNGSSVYSKVFYSSDGASWTDVSADGNWSGRNHHAATSFDGKLWVTGGGSNGSNLLNDVLSSSDGKTWIQVTSAAAWSPRHKHSLLVFNNKLYMLGGIDNSTSYMNDIWSSSDGETWTQVIDNSSWSKRYGHAATVFNNKIWIMGGDNGSLLSDVWFSSNDNASSWTQASTSGSIWSARSGHTAIVFDGKLWVIGGNGGSGTLNSWSSKDGIAWSDAGAIANETSRSGMGGVVLSNRFYISGGYIGNNTYKDDVKKYGP